MSLSNYPGDIYWKLIEPYWIPLNETWDSGVAAFLSHLRKVPSKVCHLYAAHWCQSEVRNGGFYQFFFNTTGILAPESLEGFHAIGLQDCASVLADAIKYFGEKYPRDRELCLTKLPEMKGKNRAEWNPFEKEDERFYKCLDIKENRWAQAADIYATIT